MGRRKEVDELKVKLKETKVKMEQTFEQPKTREAATGIRNFKGW